MLWHPAASPWQAAGTAASRMKAQELASTCWAWATLRYFPGAAVMDAILAASGGHFRGGGRAGNSTGLL